MSIDLTETSNSGTIPPFISNTPPPPPISDSLSVKSSSIENDSINLNESFNLDRNEISITQLNVQNDNLNDSPDLNLKSNIYINFLK